MAARGSRLSVAQSKLAIGMLRDAAPGTRFDITTVTTRGDRDSRPMFAMDRRGIFEREVNEVVADGRADFAVHSMKDVPGEIAPELTLASVPRRADPYDALVCRPGLDTEGEFVVGTSSLRRAEQARAAFPRVTVRPIRGNVDTRVSKVGGEFDAVILARAGLARLGLDADSMDANRVDLPRDVFIPSPGQGALALVCRKDDARTTSLLQTIQHAASRAEAEAERALSDILESGCRFPVAACARHDGRTIRMRAAAYGGADAIHAESSGSDPAAVGREAGRMLLERGAASLALKWREALAGWR